MKPAVLALAYTLGTSATPPTAAYEISLSVARKAIASCLTLAREKDWRLAIAIYDIGGRLVAFERMDGAFVKAGKLARFKAETASTTPLSTRDLRSLVYQNPTQPYASSLRLASRFSTAESR